MPDDDDDNNTYTEFDVYDPERDDMATCETCGYVDSSGLMCQWQDGWLCPGCHREYLNDDPHRWVRLRPRE